MLLADFPEAELTDAAHAALALARLYPEPIDALRAARNGRALTRNGRAAEVQWCAQASRYNIIGQMDGAVIRPLP